MTTITDEAQHLIDYTVRNIETGDEEDIRVLELSTEEIALFPEAVRTQIAMLITFGSRSWSDWHTSQERILALLLPFISRPELHAADLEAWHRYVLDQPDDEDQDDAEAPTTTDPIPPHPPEDTTP
jgi:hypothetical protein